MKIIFFGTPSPCLYILKSINEKFNISAVVSKNTPDNTKRRNFVKSNLNRFALDEKIPFYEPNKIDESFINAIKKYNPDLFLVCAYGKILPKSFINIPKYGTLNIHPSLLPKYRGPSPIQNTIISLDSITGYSIIKMDENIDSGDILYKSNPIILNKNEKYLDLMNLLFKECSLKINSVINKFVENKIILEKQIDSNATFTRLITKKDGLISWNESSDIIEAKFRAFHDWPQVYSYHNDKRFKILKLEKTNISSLKPGSISKLNNFIHVDSSSNKIKLLSIKLDGKKEVDPLAYFGNFDFSKTILSQ
jgi:methionyl-tRNA formyltransferase